MTTGTGLMNRCLMTLSALGATVFRNNTFSAWAGKSMSLSRGQIYKAQGGERVVFDAYPVKGGLCEGSSDIVGFVPTVITAEMVGKTLPVFSVWEVKDGTGRPTDKQLNFVNMVQAAGGIGAIVRSTDDARASLQPLLPFGN